MKENKRFENYAKIKIWAWQARIIAHTVARKTRPNSRLEINSVIKGFDKTINIEGWSVYGNTIQPGKTKTVIFEDLNGKKYERKVKITEDISETFYLFVIDKKHFHDDINVITTY